MRFLLTYQNIQLNPKVKIEFKLFFLFLLVLGSSSYAQNIDTLPYYPPAVEELLKMQKAEQKEEQTQVAGQVSLSLREAPAVVTVITEEQLQEWGITDLIEVFQFVPGFEVNRDEANTRHVSVRGSWGGEAKVLVLIDGMEMNELSYGSYPVGGRFAVGQIKKIEIIRGPGSAIYGGMAGLAVINIITKKANNKKWLEGGFTSEVSQSQFLRQQTMLSLGKKPNNDWSYQVHANLHVSNISNRFLDLPRGRANFADSSRTTNAHLLAGLQYKNLRVCAMYEKFQIKRTLDVYSTGDYNDFSGGYLLANDEWKVHPRISILPEISYRVHEPWNTYGNEVALYAMIARKFQTKIRMQYQLSTHLVWMLGAEYYHIGSRYKNDTVVFSNNKNHLGIHNIGMFSELSYQHPWLNLIAGARYDNHEFAGSAFVPRISLTKAFKRFHYKLLYAEAFKAPVVSNIELAIVPIQPENIRYAELELGYKIHEKLSFMANLFSNRITNTLRFLSTVGIAGSYINQGTSNVWGWEGQVNYQGKVLQAFLQYAFYQPLGKNDVNNIENISYAKQGIASHKISLHAHTKMGKKLTLILNTYHLGERFYYGPEEFSGDDGLRRLAPITLFDAILWWKRPWNRPLNLQFYIKDLSNEQFSYTPAYQLYLYPLPAPARTWGVRLTFDL